MKYPFLTPLKKVSVLCLLILSACADTAPQQNVISAFPDSSPQAASNSTPEPSVAPCVEPSSELTTPDQALSTISDQEEEAADLASSWVVVEDSPREDTTSLISYSRNSGQLELSFHPTLSQDTYHDILQLNDLSYAVPNTHSSTNTRKLAKLRTRISQISAQLNERNWNTFQVLYGATGARNQDRDATCVASYNRTRNIMVIAFHGSITGSKNPIQNNGRGDWGTNFDAVPVTAGYLGIEDLPATISLHRGFGNNFRSAQQAIYHYLEEQLGSLTSEELQNTWIIFTGHSKGAAMASIAAPVAKRFLQRQESLQAQAVKVAAVLISAPRVFHTEASRDWVHRTLGKRNILRINVHGDPVPLTPPSSLGYRSLGMLLLDNITQVNERMCLAYSMEGLGWLGGWLSADAWAGYHYMCSLRAASSEFDPNLVLPYHELTTGLNQGRQHIESQSREFLTESFFAVQ